MTDIMKVLVVFLLAMCSPCIVRGQKTYDSPNKHHCFYCPPGTQVQEHCKEHFTNSTCADCPLHYYSDEANDKTYCRLCMTSCPKFSRQISNCTKKTNLDCECLEGRHKFPLDPHDNSWKCFPHRKCGDGEGEVYRGNHTHNTLCQKCQEGEQFVNTSDPAHPVCQTCQRCAPGQLVLSSCTLHNDTVCGHLPDGNGSVESSTTPAGANTTVDAGGAGAGGDSDKQPSTALIVGLTVYAVLVLILFGIAFPLKKRFYSGSLTKKELFMWFLAIISVLGMVALIVWLYKNKRSSRSSESPGEGAEQLNPSNHAGSGDGNRNGPSGVPLVDLPTGNQS